MINTIATVSTSFDGQLEYSSCLYDGPNDCDSVTATVKAEYPGKTFSCVEGPNSTPLTHVVAGVEGEFNENNGEPVRPGRTLRRVAKNRDMALRFIVDGGVLGEVNRAAESTGSPNEVDRLTMEVNRL
ncbi:hypothetical protein LPJ54_006001 [Coemansia sp. RSA 1824]|nr:hypothetical protein LPJ54_006001 [Coemansia sp. RSA 1824]